MKKLLIILLLVSIISLGWTLCMDADQWLVAVFGFLFGYTLSLCIVKFVGEALLEKQVKVIEKLEGDMMDM